MDTLIRKLTRQAYDVQKLRIATGLRVVIQFKERFNISESEEPKDEEAQEKQKEKLLKAILQAYDRVTDGIAETARKKNYKFDNIIQDETEVWFIESYTGLLKEEALAFKRLENVLKQDSFYVNWLSKVRGIGPAMAGVILSEFDPYRAKYPSGFWKYAGLDVIPVFDKDTHELVGTEGRSRREHHLVEREYKAADGTMKTRRGITFNPWLKSKLLAVLATSFLRAGNEKYVKLYQDYKFRQMNRPDVLEKPGAKAIAHKRALRYMIKRFLVDLHMAWREHEGLEVNAPYEVAKLGFTHGIDPSAIKAMETHKGGNSLEAS